MQHMLNGSGEGSLYNGIMTILEICPTVLGIRQDSAGCPEQLKTEQLLRSRTSLENYKVPAGKVGFKTILG